MKPPSISQASRFARYHGARGALVLVFDANGFAGASWGKTRAERLELHALLARIADSLQRDGFGSAGASRPSPASEKPEGPSPC